MKKIRRKNKTKSKIRSTLKIIIIVFILLFVGGTFYVGNEILENSIQLVNNKETKNVPKSFWKKYNMSYNKFKNKYTIEKLKIKSTLDGHPIPADYIYSSKKDKNKNTAILVHGLGGNRLTTYPIAKMFLKHGYNVIAYDQRSSGENLAKYTTFGYLESRDLEDYVYYAKKHSKNKKLVLWGTSYGGATVGIASNNTNVNKAVDDIILDCPVSSMKSMVKEELEEMDIPLPIDYLLLSGDIMTRIKFGFGYKDVEVTNHVSKTKVPILIFNSRVDKTTPYFMGKDIYASITNKKEKIITSNDSTHADIFKDYPKLYEREVFKFIKNNS